MTNENLATDASSTYTFGAIAVPEKLATVPRPPAKAGAGKASQKADPTYLTDPQGPISSGTIQRTAEQFFNNPDISEPDRLKKAEYLLRERLIPMNARFAVVIDGGAGLIADTTTLAKLSTYNPSAHDAWEERQKPGMLTPDTFRLLTKAHKHYISPGKTWKNAACADIWMEWQGRRTYAHGFLFAPGIDQADLPHNFNLWLGWGVSLDLSTHENPQKWAYLREHLLNTVCGGNERYYTWLLAWMRDIIVHPMHKPGSAVVLRGPIGSGKSTVADVLMRILGNRYCVRLEKPDQLTGQFNGHMESKLFVNAEEAFFSGDKAATGTLKSLITSETGQTRRMRTDGYQTKSFCRILITSNEKWVIPASLDDRRFFALFVPTKLGNRKEFFTALRCELETDGVEEFAKHLLRMEVPAWVNLSKPPKTEELVRQAEETMPTPTRFFVNALKTGENYPCPEGGRVFRSDIMRDYEEWCQRHRADYAATNANLFKDLLVEWWQAEDGGMARHPATKKQGTVYVLPPLAELQATMADATGMEMDHVDREVEGEEDED